MIKTLGIGALCAAALIGGAACAPPPIAPVAIHAPLSACVGTTVTFVEGLAPRCDVRPPQTLSIRMAPYGDVAARCANMGGTMDLLADSLCDDVDY